MEQQFGFGLMSHEANAKLLPHALTQNVIADSLMQDLRVKSHMYCQYLIPSHKGVLQHPDGRDDDHHRRNKEGHH